MSSNSTVIPYLPPSDSIFDDVIRGFGLQVFACTFYCTFFYGGLYFIASLIASFNVAHTIPSKVAVVMFSTFWGLFVGFLAGFAVFALIGGIYSSFPLDMAQWEAVAFGLGLAVVMQGVAVVRRLYVYV